MAHTLPIVLHNIGPEINTRAHEYINTITADESKLIFTRKPLTEKLTFPAEELYIAHKDSMNWIVTPLKFESKENVNTGALSISPDGNTIWYTLCGASDGYGNCDLYVSHHNLLQKSLFSN